MRKEQLIAIVLGSLLGVTAAFALWKLPRQNSVNKNEAAGQIQQNQSGSALSSTSFSIVSPAQNAVARQDSAEIKGFANSGSTIVSIADGTTMAKADSSGQFVIAASLLPGINKVKLWSFENGIEPKLLELTLIHSTQVEESLSEGAFAVIGAITDIASDTLQVRTEGGEIEQLSISDDTTYGSVTGTAKEIEFTDLAIGDFVAALGVKDGNVMEIKRVLVSTQKESDDPGIIAGNIKTLSSKEFIVQKFGAGDEVSIDAKGGTKTYSSKEEEIVSTKLLNANEGDPIVVIGEHKDDELVASTIILL